MKIAVSHRSQLIKPSPTIAVSMRAAELKAAGKDIISLGVGEPDFDTPEHIKAAAIKAVNEGQTKYTAIDGTPGLKKAIIGKFKRENNLNYEPSQILVSCGAKHSIFNLIEAFINKDDEVIIPAPYWVSYVDIVQLAEGRPVIIDAEINQNFKITPEQLEKALNPKTKLLILNTPSNPSGMAYSKTELAALGKVLLKHPQVFIMTDDIYEHILWTKEPFANILNACPELYDRTIVVNGVSKSYAMTGWRIGYAAGPIEIIKTMTKIQSQNTSNACSISQAAAQAGLDGDQSFIKSMLNAFKARHDFVYQRLNTMPGVNCLPSDGTFYSFPEVKEVIKRLSMPNDLALTEHLLNHGVAVVPGSAFGMEGYIRLSYATSMENLEKALDRIQQAFK